MNVPMSWLKKYVDIDVDIKTYVDKMTLSGSKVESVVVSGSEISNVVVGKIVDEDRHPDADRLRVLKVDIGKEVLQIVTAATNVKVGDVVPVALDGATLANGLKIKKGKLRGVESNGMLCSVEELGFDKGQITDAPEDGIYVFNTPMKLGECVKSYFGLGEEIVEYEITSNRADCFGILGIAREAAATFNKPFKYPLIEVDEVSENIQNLVTIHIENPELCSRYSARIIKNVKVKPSPKWLADKLISVGLRPINNIVDITNFILLEFSQPMHAFDYDKLVDKEIIVRKAKSGEKIDTLLGDTIGLDDSMLIIADKTKPIAIAGVMGGEDTKVTEKTTNILFECATFDAASIRHTSKKLGLISDSSKKYVKGLDPNQVKDALDRAAQLINMIDAGDVLSGVVDVYPIKREPLTINYDYNWINKFLGTNIKEKRMEEIFTRLEFNVDWFNRKVTIPTYRPDITMNADLAEEVARIYGYDKIPTTLERARPTVGGRTNEQQIVNKIKETLRLCGLYGAYTYTIESPKVFDKLNINPNSPLRNALQIQNPLGEDFSILRTTTINAMLTALSTNNNRRNEKTTLYEIGKIFVKQEDNPLPKEVQKITIGLYTPDADFFNIKSIVEALLDTLKIEKYSITRNSDLEFMHPGRCANLTVDNQQIGFFGEVHPQVLKNYEINQKAYVCELDLDLLVQKNNSEIVFKPLPKYPTSTRDLAIIIKDDVLVGDVIDLIKLRGGKLLQSVVLFDVYIGEQIEEGYKSVAFKLIFRADDRTLTDVEIQKVIANILTSLEESYLAKLRE